MTPAEIRFALTEAIGLLTPVDALGLEKRRLGNRFDGGYVLAGAFLDVHAAYSFGIGPDVSFDLELAGHGIPVRMFDHTVEGPGAWHDLFTFHKQGLGAADKPEESLFTLEHHLRRCGDWGRTDLLLKMDVEGAELPAFARCGPGILRHFRQIVLELHWLQRLMEPEYRAEFVAAMGALRAGFHIVHVHANNCVPVFLLDGLPVPAVLELTLVRRDLVQSSPNRTVYPTELDYANNEAALDYPLWYFPFLPSSGADEARPGLDVTKASRAWLADAESIAAVPVLPAAVPASPAMSDEAVVRALFLLCLGREVDPDALKMFVGLASANVDKSVVLAALLQSAEHAQAAAGGLVLGVDLTGHRTAGAPVVVPALEDDRIRAMVPELAKMVSMTPIIFGDASRLRVGHGVQLINTLFNMSSGDITIGDYVFFGHNVCLLTGTHDVTRFDVDRQIAIPENGRDIIIGRGAWVSTNVTVLGPCRIGEDAVVAAGSVITEDVPAGWLVAGVPARPVKPVSAKYGAPA